MLSTDGSLSLSSDIMSFEEVKDRYGFTTVRFATWRDPRDSTHWARGGPKTPTITPEAAAKPYIPKYKVKYKVPEPTDDEESEDEDEEEDKESSIAGECKVDLYTMLL